MDIDNVETPSMKIDADGLDFLKKQLEQLNEDHKVDLSEYKHIFDATDKIKKQTDAKYEIYINLTANILENIDGSEFPESKSINSNNYYIPVPSGQDHNQYLKAFFDYIEHCMSASAEKAAIEDNING